MKGVVIFLVFIAAGPLMGSAAEEPTSVPSPGMGSTKSGSQMHHGRGIIATVDMETGKLNIEHQPVPSLGLPATNTDFKTRNQAVLTLLKPGQEVRFTFEEGADGQYIITRITPLE